MCRETTECHTTPCARADKWERAARELAWQLASFEYNHLDHGWTEEQWLDWATQEEEPCVKSVSSQPSPQSA